MIICVKEFLEQAKAKKKNVKTVYYFIQKGGDKEIRDTVIRTVDSPNLLYNMKRFKKTQLIEEGHQTLQFEWSDMGTGAFYTFTDDKATM
jgi:hypothetical protein